MQRILSVETSRNSNLTSEFVTKRLCCSFILTVAFFAIIGGFFLGRFASDKTLQKLKMEISEMSQKITTLDKSLTTTFHETVKNCSFISKMQCKHFWTPTELTRETTLKSTQELLDVLNSCFNYG